MITLQFSTTNDLGSKMISWFSHGQGVTHVDAVLPTGELLGSRGWKIKGVAPGVQIRPPDYSKFSRTLVVELDATRQQTIKFYDFLHKQIGKPYDNVSILNFVIRTDWRDNDAWFCSELIGFALEKAGWFKYHLATPMNRLTPDDLLLAISVLKKIAEIKQV